MKNYEVLFSQSKEVHGNGRDAFSKAISPSVIVDAETEEEAVALAYVEIIKANRQLKTEPSVVGVKEIEKLRLLNWHEEQDWN